MSEPPSYLFILMFADGDAVASTSVAMLTLKIGSVLLLVAANRFFVAAEFALVGVRQSRIETLAAAGKASAIRLLRLLDNLNPYLSASQLGITLASLHIVLGEQAPKLIGRIT
jgi:CBS domain containing-hemolysin-like protein